MSVPNNIPMPVNDPVGNRKRTDKYKGDRKDPQEGLISDPWRNYWTQQGLLLEQFPARVKVVELSAQSASIGATDMTDGGLSAGWYRISYFWRITQAATVSSSISIAFDWTDDGVTLTHTGGTSTVNAVDAYESGGVELFYTDSNSPIRYSVTYASVGATPMLYKLQIVLSEVLA